MKKILIMLTVFCTWVLSVSAAASGVNEGSTGSNMGSVSFVIGIALLVLIVLRGWRIGVKTRKRYAESEKKAYSYIPRGERAERYRSTDMVRSRSALEDMDFPSGFGGIHNMEQLEHNRALYRLYCEMTENVEGWDDARR